jgi:glycosyltransferase involved in cell wall biosynthesis
LYALSVQETLHPYEVVVVDNQSDDATRELVTRYSVRDRRIRVVEAPDRPGLSYARNVGVHHSRGDFVAFCDDDDLVSQAWVDGLVETLQCHPFVASAMEYRLLNGDAHIGRSAFQSESIGQLFGIPVANGAIGIARSLWLSVGGADENFVTGGEDFDLAVRVGRQLGIEPVLAESAIYHYRHRDDSRTTFRQAFRFGRSHVQLYQRHGRGRVDLVANNRAAARDWWWITTRLPWAVLGRRSNNWAWRCGRRSGRLVESLLRHERLF